jgi:hypothetical protein
VGFDLEWPPGAGDNLSEIFESMCAPGVEPSAGLIDSLLDLHHRCQEGDYDEHLARAIIGASDGGAVTISTTRIAVRCVALVHKNRTRVFLQRILFFYP